MPQDHPWTEAPFGYSGQNLEIFDTTANESINVQNILIEEMHDPILQIKNSLQDPWQKFENDMQKIIQELKEKLSKRESQNSAPKVMVQKKSEHSYAAKPKEVHDDNRSNSSPPSKIHDHKVVNQEKAQGIIFSGIICQISGLKRIFPRGKN